MRKRPALAILKIKRGLEMNEREYLENFERTQIRVVTTLLKATENVDAIKTSEKMIAQGHAKRVLSLFGNVLENRY